MEELGQKMSALNEDWTSTMNSNADKKSDRRAVGDQQGTDYPAAEYHYG